MSFHRVIASGKDMKMPHTLKARGGREEPIENHSIPRIFFSKVGNQKLRTAIWSGVDKGEGKRTPLLFFNGIGANLEIAQAFADTFTGRDIITFDMRDAKGQPIEADIFISIDRVKENSISEGVAFLNELHRVLIHGFLHLVGYPDKTVQEAAEMRTQEEKCLSLLEL